MGDTSVCDQVCLGTMLTSSLFSGEKSQSSPVDETPGEGIYDYCVPFGRSVSRQIRGVQKKSFPAFTFFHMPTAQKHQHTKVAYFVVT